MRRVLRGGVLIVGMLAAIAADCCDPNHDNYTEQQKEQRKDIDICRDRGGIPITDTKIDDGGHGFTKLARCDFPGQIKLQGEK